MEWKYSETYNENIHADENSVYLVRFPEKNINYMPLNSFDQMAPLKHGMILRLNTSYV